jgi:hypothetical protein
MTSPQIETQITELNNKFKRLVYNLGNNNSSGFTCVDGTVKRLRDSEGNEIGPSARYNYEVEFAYIMAEVNRSPDYIIQKYVDKANELITQLISEIKDKNLVEE